MNIENAKKWSAALRSGKYRQAREIIQDFDGALCCLGVAHKCLIGKIPVNSNLAYKPVSERLDFDESIESGFAGGNFLELNDGRLWSFEQIADYIDAQIAKEEEAKSAT